MTALSQQIDYVVRHKPGALHEILWTPVLIACIRLGLLSGLARNQSKLGWRKGGW